MQRTVAIDIGIQTMSMAVLDTPMPSPKTGTHMERVLELLRSAHVESWTTSSLSVATRASLPTLLDATTAWCRDNSEAFARANLVVIENQPARKMQSISVAIYTMARSLCPPSARVFFQSPLCKLRWDGLQAYLPQARLDTYWFRKKTAVLLSVKLLGDAGRNLDADFILGHKKKDDLADALLHALAALCPAPVSRRVGTASGTSVTPRRPRAAPRRSGSSSSPLLPADNPG